MKFKIRLNAAAFMRDANGRGGFLFGSQDDDSWFRSTPKDVFGVCQSDIVTTIMLFEILNVKEN